ncbi:TPA: isocitrate/isopropylmalate dehydrogenase family protein [Burkholderia cenocepacia]|uniref:Tartrate dehydrogenase n=1 Tax=Burkholderia arboris TaxID=488730 RepID=A0A9Q9SRG9_9BURK|nr:MULTISPECIES: isocitrate/isopropylmalate family dehydrogenase [Burkholderia cepacia complex]MCW3693218.1 isocitrate/isopropylmalate dehydrogenase family protein [Burkholderia cenocepacia]QUN38875.1 isocitrate/isopropylmalate dehydrogenase family protein [Burkholderia cenocepacia]QUO29223.1 isocitrate/isopropylmalate dehydrogenase family protein [Burkholderia cenocepacia]VWC44912.1 tartrate dehydrogenase [Burkholderia arboris]
MRIVLLPGDGIGPEITKATECVLQAASDAFGLHLEFISELAGHESLAKHGATVTPELLESVRAADGLVLGPMATYDFKDEAKGEINPSKFFRKSLDLYANVRPSRTYRGLRAPVGEFDLVVVRENTEGFYADRNMEQGNGEILVTSDVAISLRRITRQCCVRIAHAAFELAMQRKRHVSIVHKANVLKIGDGMFIDACQEVARAYPEVIVDDFIVDAMMAHVVRAPQRFDVVVTTNMFGDILSDLTSELSGSLGLAGSLNSGGTHAMAQAAHGSAPDIAGKNVANPFSLILSAALLLRWHGQKSAKNDFLQAATAIEHATAAAIAAKEATRDVGGNLGTHETGEALGQRLHALAS